MNHILLLFICLFTSISAIAMEKESPAVLKENDTMGMILFKNGESGCPSQTIHEYITATLKNKIDSMSTLKKKNPKLPNDFMFGTGEPIALFYKQFQIKSLIASAASYNNLDAVKFLIKGETDVNFRYQSWWIYNPCKKIIVPFEKRQPGQLIWLEFLGMTTLHCACDPIDKNTSEDNVMKMVNLLVNAGANVDLIAYDFTGKLAPNIPLKASEVALLNNYKKVFHFLRAKENKNVRSVTLSYDYYKSLAKRYPAAIYLAFYTQLVNPESYVIYTS